MTVYQFLTTLRARWLSALLVLVTCVGVTMTIALLMPKRYSAAASVVIDVKSPDPLTGMALAGMVMPSYMATQVDVLRSGRTARRVIQALGLGNNTQLRQQWLEETQGRGDFEGWVSELLRRNLEVKPSRESNALTVTYTSPDPAFSAAMANAFVQAFIDTTLELRIAPAREFSTFFDERSRQARDALEAAQAKLSQYQRANGLLATDERLDVETARLQELSSQVVMLQALAAESSGRANQAANNGDRLQEVLSNPLVAQLNMDLSRMQARLEELTSRLGDQNPQVIEVRAQITEMRRRLDTESRRVVGSVGVNNSVTQSRLGQVQASLAEQRARVLRLKQQRDEAAVLERDVESARLAYQSIVQRLNQTTVEAQSTQTNVAFLERAFVPAEPSSPRLLLVLLVSLSVGTLLAVATAQLRELRDRRLRSQDDIIDALALPVLGILPNASPKALARKGGSVALLQRRVLGGLGKA